MFPQVPDLIVLVLAGGIVLGFALIVVPELARGSMRAHWTSEPSVGDDDPVPLFVARQRKEGSKDSYPRISNGLHRRQCLSCTPGSAGSSVTFAARSKGRRSRHQPSTWLKPACGNAYRASHIVTKSFVETNIVAGDQRSESSRGDVRTSLARGHTTQNKQAPPSSPTKSVASSTPPSAS